ncbi:MAG: aminoacyl-tRNA hydrolase [Ignavibacteria bacterium]|nr:aminoacyl-tRNA hydrolase [Ignavibacteria bacterium]
MILIVGLGNPGKKYQFTRHNIGFRVIDELAPLTLEGVVLAKPKTYMNESGKAIKSLLRNLVSQRLETKFLSKNLFVIHDDIDIPLGEIKIVKNRGAGGHRGVESIIKELKTKTFIRFRIGILPKTGKPKNSERFVLQKFNKEEEKIVREAIEKTVKAVEITSKEGLEKAMNKFNN